MAVSGAQPAQKTPASGTVFTPSPAPSAARRRKIVLVNMLHLPGFMLQSVLNHLAVSVLGIGAMDNHLLMCLPVDLFR
jgi:hypothetical protein